MSKTAKNKVLKTAEILNAKAIMDLSYMAECSDALTIQAMFSVMRALKRVNPGDAYLENYLGMRAKYGKEFHDTYQLLWAIGAAVGPKRILEIGTRTGISICQLLFAHKDLESVEAVVCVDPFDQWTSPNLVRANLAYLGLPHDQDTVTIHPVTSDEYFAMPRPADFKLFDYILVDGDHSKAQARKDLDNALKLIAPRGIIVFDDISTAPGECALEDVWEAWAKDNKDSFAFFKDMRGKGVAHAIKL